MFGFHKLVFAAVAAFAVLGVSASFDEAKAQGSDPYLGQVMLVPYTYCPNGWLEANGTLLPIAQYSALFALYGTTYGGDGVRTFAVPNLQGRAPIGQGQGPGLSPYQLGQTGGAETVTLNSQQLPMHTHSAQTFVNAVAGEGGQTDPSNNLLSGGPSVYSSGQPDARLSQNAATTTVGPSGGSQPVSILNPYLALRWCVALSGIFPSRP